MYKKCLVCGNEFSLSRRNKDKANIYCSNKCKGISISKKRKKESNPNWKGKDAKIRSIHRWLERNYENKKCCDICGTTKAKRYDWSNKDHKYTRNLDDWQYVCRSCHLKYDYNLRGEHDIICAFCGKITKAKSIVKKFCSANCNLKHSRKSNK